MAIKAIVLLENNKEGNAVFSYLILTYISKTEVQKYHNN